MGLSSEGTFAFLDFVFFIIDFNGYFVGSVAHVAFTHYWVFDNCDPGELWKFLMVPWGGVGTVSSFIQNIRHHYFIVGFDLW